MVEKQYTFRLKAKGGKQVEGEFKKVAGGLKESGKLIEKEAIRINKSVSVFGRADNSTIMGNLGLQLSQVAQQGATTGNYLRALAIQIPDLMLGFGTIGIMVGAAAAALIPFAGGLLDISSNAEHLRQSMDDAEESLRSFEAASKIAAAPVESLTRKYGQWADEIQRLSRAIAGLEKQQVMGRLRDAFEAYAPDLAYASESTALRPTIENYLRRLDEIDARIEKLRGKGARAEGAIAQQEKQREWILGRLNDLIGEQARLLGLSVQQALEFGAALKTAMSEDGEQQAAALKRMVDLIENGQADITGLTREEKENRADLLKLLQRALMVMGEMEATSGGIASNMDAAAKAAARSADAQFKADSFLFSRRFADEEKLMALPVKPTEVKKPKVRRTGGGGGGISPIEKARKEYEQLRASVDKAYAAQLRFKEAEETVQEALARGVVSREEAALVLEKVRQSIEETMRVSDEFARSLKDGILDAITGARDLGDVFDQLAKQIQRAAWEALLFNEGMFATKGGGGGLLGGFIDLLTGALTGGSTTAAVKHSGGMVGAGDVTRSVHASVFSGAPRYHRGGIAGLRPDEVPAILQRGEMVIPKGVRSSSSGGRVQVLITVDESGNIRPVIQEVAGQVAAQVGEAQLEHYDRVVLPGRMTTINSRRAG